MGSSQSQQKPGTGMAGMFGQSAPSSGMFGQSAPSSGMFGQSAPQGQSQSSGSWFGGRKRKSKGKKKNNRKTKRRM